MQAFLLFLLDPIFLFLFFFVIAILITMPVNFGFKFCLAEKSPEMLPWRHIFLLKATWGTSSLTVKLFYYRVVKKRTLLYFLGFLRKFFFFLFWKEPFEFLLRIFYGKSIKHLINFEPGIPSTRIMVFWSLNNRLVLLSLYHRLNLLLDWLILIYHFHFFFSQLA